MPGLDGLDVVGAGVGLGEGGVVGGATVGLAVVGAGLGADVVVLEVEVPAPGVVVRLEAFALADRGAAAG